MDYSFLKLYDSITDALNDNEFKDAGIYYYTSIQLFTDEPYLQMTNYEGGISIDSDFTCSLVDTCNNQLVDITAHVFIEEFIDLDGNTQCKIEFVNIPSTFYGRAVIIRISQNSSNAVYYTRPIKITNKGSLKTYRFDYTNNSNLPGLTYDNADCYQSTRLNMKYVGKSNSSEVGDYYQISTGNNISTRFLKNVGSNYLIENIDTYTFDRIQEMLLHDVIYIDGRRITNKPILEQGDRIGESTLFKATFTAFINESDTYDYEYQVFDGLNLFSLSPIGTLNICDTGTNLEASFNIPIEIGTGTLMLYDASDDSLVHTWDQDDCYLSDAFTLSVSGLSTYVEASTSYYIVFSSGLVTAIGIVYEGFNDTTTWAFNVVDGEYDEDEYNNDEYVVGCTFVGRIHNDLFNDTYN